jgi:hypothetical protein
MASADHEQQIVGLGLYLFSPFTDFVNTVIVSTSAGAVPEAGVKTAGTAVQRVGRRLHRLVRRESLRHAVYLGF